jgi:hypothetical protein
LCIIGHLILLNAYIIHDFALFLGLGSVAWVELGLLVQVLEEVAVQGAVVPLVVEQLVLPQAVVLVEEALVVRA